MDVRYKECLRCWEQFDREKLEQGISESFEPLTRKDNNDDDGLAGEYRKARTTVCWRLAHAVPVYVRLLLSAHQYFR